MTFVFSLKNVILIPKENHNIVEFRSHLWWLTWLNSYSQSDIGEDQFNNMFNMMFHKLWLQILVYLFDAIYYTLVLSSWGICSINYYKFHKKTSCMVNRLLCFFCKSEYASGIFVSNSKCWFLYVASVSSCVIFKCH